MLYNRFFCFSILYIAVKVKLLSRVQLFVTPWTLESVEFSRPEHEWAAIPIPYIVVSTC